MRKARPKAPGSNNNEISQMFRVDHAGEMAAVEIYKSQLKVFRHAENDGKIEHILAHQEQEEIAHKAKFDELLLQNAIRPTMLEPLWKPLSQFLGYSTALMGIKNAHACTQAVEEAIEEHYQAQEDNMDNGELKNIIIQFKEEEIAHKNQAIDEGSNNAFGFPILSAFIKTGCKTAIALSHKI